VKRTLRFKASARLQSILSRELVADPNVALLEFVKNGYDAAASRVLVRFELGEHPRDSIIWIADNGEGMDLLEFQRDWMRPGYSKKAGHTPPSGKRVPVGEKGLGRLAAGRLGGTLDVYTRPKPNVRWLHAYFRWSDFDDMTRDLDDIKISIDDEQKPPVAVASTGTIIRISDLHLNWNARVPGRKVPGRADTRLGRLRQDLEVLLLPLTALDDDFEIMLEHNSSSSEDRSGEVEPPTLDALDYAFDFEFKRVRNKWETTYRIRRSSEIAEETGAPTRTKGRVALPPLPLDTDPAAVGAFTGSFLYAPRSATRLREMRAPLGVRIYRDGVRVDPYGEDGDDWLGARAKKASRQGYAAIQPNALYGAVEITKAQNPRLVAMANREGLIENESYDAFVAICQGLFGEFEKIVYDELVEPKWRTLPEKRQAAAEAQQAFAFMLARTAVHAVRQPVSGAGAELDRLQQIVDSTDLAAGVRSELQELHDRTLAHLTRIEDIVARMLDVFDFEPEPSDFDLAEVVEAVVTRIGASAESHDIDVRVRAGAAHPVVSVSRDLVEHALTELIENAIHADRARGAQGIVEVVVEDEGGEATMTVVDDGEGIPEEIRKHLFARAQSTRGRIGFGLILTRQMLRLMRGDVLLASTGEDGTAFRIVLPIPSDGQRKPAGDPIGGGR
jgi:signal transduction histidine kinase